MFWRMWQVTNKFELINAFIYVICVQMFVYCCSLTSNEYQTFWNLSSISYIQRHVAITQPTEFEPTELRIYTSCLCIDNRGYCKGYIYISWFVSNVCQNSLCANESERSTADKQYVLKSDNKAIQKIW
jgi:hypothetical protein